MSLFKKLFKKEADAEPTRKHGARSNRVLVTPLHRISFRPASNDKSQGDKLMGLRNISTGGMAVICGQGFGWKMDDVISGILVVDKDEFTIEARIKHLTEILAGCEFQGDNLTLKRAIEGYLKVEILALNLRPIADAYLKPDPRGKAHWFTDGKENELYCVSDAQGLVAFHMSFLGHYLEWSKDKGIRAGNIRVSDDKEVPAHKGAELLDLSKSLARETVTLARIFTQNIERMPKELRSDLEAKLTQEP